MEAVILTGAKKEEKERYISIPNRGKECELNTCWHTNREMAFGGTQHASLYFRQYTYSERLQM